MGFMDSDGPRCPARFCGVPKCSYPCTWLGIFADAPPSCDQLIYCHSERGFALHSMRSPRVSLYLQVDPDERVEDWPDRRIWDELHLRLAQEGWSLTEARSWRRGSRRAQLRGLADAPRTPLPCG